VAIEDPWQAEFAAFRIVAPRGLALATSGHRANGVTGRLATSHIVDPRTQRPSISAIASVSVLDATGERADALATALCAMGAAGPDFARQNGISALFIAGQPDAPHEIPTGSFPDHLVA
jgi:thiamine biosynthesis lipoprotein